MRNKTKIKSNLNRQQLVKSGKQILANKSQLKWNLFADYTLIFLNCVTKLYTFFGVRPKRKIFFVRSSQFVIVVVVVTNELFPELLLM